MESPFVRAAGEIAREAGQFLKHFSDHHRLSVERKGSDFDFVTNADRQSQQLIRDRLKEAFPGHRFVGEEDGLPDAEVARILHSGDYCWVCDPLDGTVNYIHHLPLYAVSLGLVKDGEALAGAIYVPEAGELFVAAKGGGATLNGQPIRVSGCSELRHAFITADIASTGAELRRENLDRIARVATDASGARMLGSACVAIARVACGRQDAYWNLGLHAWDVAAGIVLLEEAGGVVSDVFSAPFSFDMSGGFLCCAPGLKGAFTDYMGRR